ncbi:MAG TPA: SPFH domain-containing protein [Planctomycetaceae bacterium]|jgi:regulator of protease activity HflC (stomatin/prohibitin superfamily)
MSQEIPIHAKSGWLMLPINLALIVGGFAATIWVIVQAGQYGGERTWFLLLTVPTTIIGFIFLGGFFTLQPNEARVLILFGDYRGTVRESGFFWANPFLTKPKMSLRTRNMETQRLKVNDKRGNPIEIAAVVVWRIQDTAQASFDVNRYEEYVKIQSETAVRHLANTYAYDHGEEGEITLRSGVDEVSVALCHELQDRVGKAGVVVEEARLTHLAYAQEIANAMLRRQQAEAIIAARQKIVHGAVSMVQMALEDLAAKQVVELDNERKAAMVSNLLVVLCGEGEVTPIVNAGTLYT